MTSKIITYSFYLLFTATPLLWTPWNFELFEYNKMMFVYILTTVITASWIIQMIKSKTFILKTTPLDIFLILFLSANILSTIFSTDRHTSLWGYYSRSNGGLLSLISYLLLYYALVSNFNSQQVLRFLKSALFGGFLVAVYAIPEHFGASLSCLFLTGQLDAACWVQDVQARVFATLGQPNWLAAYLAMLIFPTFYFLLSSTRKTPLILNSAFLILLYLAFTFTYSRGATLGLLAGILVFIFLLTIPHLLSFLRKQESSSKIISRSLVKPGMTILLGFLMVNLLFGSALTDFKLLSKFAPPSRPSLTSLAKPSGTQLENGGTESGKIRLIVWKGAWEIFKHYPIFGSGVETFAYSYYNFRPQEHNLVSEWDFLYNKAHNEFLNYLATTGILGFGTYMAIVIAFIYWAIKFQILNFKFSNNIKNSNIQGQNLQLPSSNFQTGILTLTLLASYISYLVQNLFGFSVVIIAVFFYLFPAIAFITTNSTKPFQVPKKFLILNSIFLILYKRSFYPKIATWAVIILSIVILSTFIRNYLADTNFAVSSRYADTNPGKAYNELLTATFLNPSEPYYQSELGYAAAAASVALSSDDATTSARLKDEAISETSRVLAENPANVSYLRTAVRMYYLLGTMDKQSLAPNGTKTYSQKTLEVLDQAIKLAPTDAKLTYNKAIILGQMGKNNEAIDILEHTLRIKPNYKEAYLSLGLFYFEAKEKDKALEQMNKLLKLIPGDPQALEKLKEWGGK